MQTSNGSYLLSYSTNVHPGESLDEIRRIISRDVSAVRERFCPGEKFGIELRMGNSVIAELHDNCRLNEFAAFVEAQNLFVFSINGFPLRDFHQPVVKEDVYRPDWSESGRQNPTVALCDILAALLPDEFDGSISTSPGSFKAWGDSPELRERLARGFAPVIARMAEIKRDSGKNIALAVEPEPFCTYETVSEFVWFFKNEAMVYTVNELVAKYGLAKCEAEAAVRDHLGINLDACHLAVEFEDAEQAFSLLVSEGILIPKVHISSAARVLLPAENPEGMKLLRRLNEPKYLHQTFAIDKSGRVAVRARDLPEVLELGDEALEPLAEIRTHYHMPLFESTDGPLGSTSDITDSLLRLVTASRLEPHIVTETYTWPLLLGTDGFSVYDGICRELQWTRDRLASEG